MLKEYHKIDYISDYVRIAFKNDELYEIQIGVTARKGICRRADQEEFEEVAKNEG